MGEGRDMRAELARSIYRDAENMARLAIMAYAQGEFEIFADLMINAGKIVKTARPEPKKDDG